VEADVYAKSCPSRQVLDRIGDAWSVLIVYSLGGGVMRYTELANRINGVSPKMLTQTLRALERDGLVTRTVYPVVPPRVDYELTDLGRSLLSLCEALTAWAEKHIEDVMGARDAYDTRESEKAAA
jgi:DNA-binding HxlR family transcriptional regulator